MGDIYDFREQASRDEKLDWILRFEVSEYDLPFDEAREVIISKMWKLAKRCPIDMIRISIENKDRVEHVKESYAGNVSGWVLTHKYNRPINSIKRTQKTST